MTFRLWTVFVISNFFFASLIAPVAAGKGLKCWSNMKNRLQVLKKIDAADTAAEHEEALSLMEKPVEQTCPPMEICGEMEIDLQVSNRDAYFDLKGCMPFNFHQGICEKILDMLADNEVTGENQEENDCTLSAYYCVDNLCNTSNVGLIVGVTIGVIAGIVLLSLIVYIAVNEYKKRRGGNKNANANYNNNNNNNFLGSGAISKRSKERRKSEKRAKSRSKSQEYRRVTEADNSLVNDSLEEVAIP